MDGLGRLERLLVKAAPGPWFATHNARAEESRIVSADGHDLAMLDGRRYTGEHDRAEMLVSLVNVAPELIQVARTADIHSSSVLFLQDEDGSLQPPLQALRDALAALARKLDGPSEEKP